MSGHHDCHDHHHGHAPATFNHAFIIAIIANGLFVVGQMIVAYLANSTSLFADAVHNLGDVFSLIVAWVGNRLLKRTPTLNATYGMKKASIMAALTNVLLLVFTCGIIVSEAIYKFLSPGVVNTNFVIVVAGLGIIVNAATAALFARGGHDLNIRAAFLHLVSDALVSLGVVCAALILRWTHWLWLDPLMGLMIAAIILKSTGMLFADSLRLLLDGVPRGISVTKVHDLLRQQPGVQGLHDLHIWALSTQENALSVHLWMPNIEQQLTDEARLALSRELKFKHGIHHVTIQIEREMGSCEDACISYLI